MSDADDAYEKAKKLIADALLKNDVELSFNYPDTFALKALPPEIATLKGLLDLDLRNTQVSDLGPISSQFSLRALDLDFAPITSLAPISKLKRLASLSLGSTRVTDLTPIAELTGLTDLRLTNTQIIDFSSIGSLVGLRKLWLDHTQIRDLAFLAPLTELTELNLKSTKIFDLTPISTHRKLETLLLDSIGVTDISPLATLDSLYWLDLDRTQVADLSAIAGLIGLGELYLRGTQVSDLSPLSDLIHLNALALDNTPVEDLRPLRGLAELIEGPLFSGLNFKNTAATRADPRIAEIAEIEDNATRARELFAYLEHWVPPGETPSLPPKPDPILETILTDGKLELAADPPSQEERFEPLKKALHVRLQTAAPNLARAAGNLFPKLAAKARILAGLVEQPFESLDLLSIHFEVEDLNARLTLGTEDDILFSDDVLGPLSDITRTGPGLTLGHASVDLFMTRVREAREAPQPVAEEAAHRALSQAMVDDPAANGPNSIAMENRIAALEDQAHRQAGWKAKHQWLVWTLATTQHLANAATVGGAAVATLEQVFGVPVSTFIASNAPLLMDIAASYGGAMFDWFTTIMGPSLFEIGAWTGTKNTKPPK